MPGEVAKSPGSSRAGSRTQAACCLFVEFSLLTQSAREKPFSLCLFVSMGSSSEMRGQGKEQSTYGVLYPAGFCPEVPL